mgnify:CR=1 FL=1
MLATMSNKNLLSLIILLMCITTSWAQSLEIEKVMDVAPGVTTTFSPILIMNNTDDAMIVEEIKVEIKNSSHIRWSDQASPKSIYTELYNRKFESRIWVNLLQLKKVKYLYIPRLLDLVGSKRYVFEEEENTIEKYNINDEGNVISLRHHEEKFGDWVLAKGQGIRLTNLPLIADNNLESDRVDIQISLKLIDKNTTVVTSSSVELNPFIPHGEILGNISDHVSFMDKRNLRDSRTKENIFPGALQITCPNSETMFQSRDKIYLEIMDTQGGIEWANKTFHVFDGEDNEIEFGAGKGYEKTGIEDEQRYTVISFELTEKAGSKNIRIEGLAIKPRKKDGVLTGTYNLKATIVSGNRHIIPIRQKIMFGNPTFTGSDLPIFLYPDQMDVRLPIVALKENDLGSLITAEHGIRLKIADKIDSVRQSVELTSPDLSWSNNMLKVEYKGSAEGKMMPVVPKIQSDEIQIQVSEDFQPGDDIEIHGLQVQTMQNLSQTEFKIIASFDGGENYFDIFGKLASYPRTINIYNPQLVFNQGSNQKFLFQGKQQALGDISIINQGNDRMFQTNDTLLIKLDNNIGTTWWKRYGNQPSKLEGESYVKSLSYLTVKDEIMLIIKAPLPPNERIRIGGIGLQDFKKKGSSTFSLALMKKASQPIATSASRVEVTTPLVNSLYSQILTRSEPIQELVGVKLTRHTGLGFDNEGILLRLPENLPVTWFLEGESQPKVLTNGKIINTTISGRASNKQILIKPEEPLGETVYIHDLNVSIFAQSSMVDTGRITFSFNEGYSFSNRDEHMLRFIEPQDHYSEDIKKFKTISSNLAADDEPVLVFIAPMKGERKGPEYLDFMIAADCSLRYSSDYYNPKRVSKQAAKGKNFTLPGDKSVEAPGAALIVNNLRISGLREHMKKVRLGFAIHNFSGVDTILSSISIYNMAQKVTTLKPQRDGLGILPDIKVTGGNWESAGPNAESLVLTEVKILNPIMSATENNRIQVLSESNINNIRIYIDLHEFEEARKKIDRIILHSSKYWIGYWLQHYLYATQNQIEDARMAIAEAERFGWVSSYNNYPKHMELIDSPIDRARFHYRTATEHYHADRLWEADSMISMLRDNYVNSGLLDTVDGGNLLMAGIFNLGADVSKDFHDYTTAAEYYYGAADRADDPEYYEDLAELSSSKADSVNGPYTGEIQTEMLPLSEIDFVVRNPFATSGTLLLTGPGMHRYPIEIAKQPQRMDEVIVIQGGVNYRIHPQPSKEEFKRLGTAILCATGLLGVAYYNQGF